VVKYYYVLSFFEEWDMYLKSVWWGGGYGRINGGTRALELALVTREATPRKGAR
jgi:hypothetical protein